MAAKGISQLIFAAPIREHKPTCKITRLALAALLFSVFFESSL